jgi:phosphoglycolate phosphatase-like HAD superfamily hydrolase
MERLAVGFDLDMTLIDTGPGIGAVLDALGEELGVEFAIAEITAALGPPLHHVFADYLPAEQVPAAVDRFRALYPDLAIEPVELLPGAAESVAAVRRHGGRVVVVTGKHGPNARLHVDHLGVDLDHLGGGAWGVGKADVLRAEGVSVYVGDHVHDVEGARAAGALSVSVLTGGSNHEDLLAAGTDVVLASLEEFPAWLDDHLA